MHILIIGGTRFVGYLTAWRLLAAGHTLTLFNRGTLPDPFGDRVHRLHGDRTTPDFARLLAGKHFDAVIDFAAYTGADAQQAIDIFSGNIGHYLFISTGQVYLIRQNCPWPARESDYAGPLIPEPAPDSIDHHDWLYGIHKRAAEDILSAAFATAAFPATRLRIPMVNGERDHYRRIESYLWRLLDGGPLLLPDALPCRHIYGQEVANFIHTILGNPATFGQAYNLSQIEQPTLAQLARMLADLLGSRAEILPISSSALAAKNLRPLQISPFSDPWMSRLDPALAQTTLHFTHQPLDRYLEKITASFLAHPPSDRPNNYTTHRKLELELARTSVLLKHSA